MFKFKFLSKLFPKRRQVLNPSDKEFLEEQAKLLSGQIRGVINEKARAINEESIFLHFMELASSFYKQGFDDCLKEKILNKDHSQQ